MLRWCAPSFSCGAEMFPIDGEGVWFFFKLFFWSPPTLCCSTGREFCFFFLTFFWSPPTSCCSQGESMPVERRNILKKMAKTVPRRPTLAVDGWWHPCGILMIMPQMLLAGWMFGPRTDLSMFKNFVDGCLLFSPFGWFGGNFDMFLLRF